MLPNFILPESSERQDGASEPLDLGSSRGKPLLITLGITRVIEQETLDVSIWGSADGQEWGAKPLLVFPQKFYCGVYTLVLDLAQHPGVTHLKAQWKMSRWGRGTPEPLCGFYVFAKEASAGASASA